MENTMKLDTSTWKKVKLGDICKSLKKGTLKTTDLVEGGRYPVINAGRELYGYYDDYNNDGECITLASRGEYAGNVHYFNERFWAGGLCYPYTSKNENVARTKYVYQYLKMKESYIRENLVRGGGVPALNKADLDSLDIELPDINTQDKIVKALTTLDNLIEARGGAA